MGYDTSKYWVNKQRRSEIAKMHTSDMERLYGDEIKECFEESRVYNDDFKVSKITYDEGKMEIILEEIDSVSAVLKYANENEITSVLNFAHIKIQVDNFIMVLKLKKNAYVMNLIYIIY